MLVGKSIQLHINHYPEDLKDVTKARVYIREWSSSSAEVASVDNWGEVKALSEGETVITVKPEKFDVTASCRIIVSSIPIDTIEFKKPSYKVYVGSTIQLGVDVKPDTATYKNNLIYTSSNEKIAIVSKEGIVEGVKEGKCQIEATSPDGTVSDVCTIEVLPVEVTNVTLTKNDAFDNNLTIKKGDTYKFKLVIEPENATNKTIEWVSSDESVATISADGTLSAVEIGECTISANTANSDVKVDCKVTVIAGEE